MNILNAPFASAKQCFEALLLSSNSAEQGRIYILFRANLMDFKRKINKLNKKNEGKSRNRNAKSRN